MAGTILKALSAQADTINGGSGRVHGIVDRLTVPGSYRVRLFDKRFARLIRETWSHAETGVYDFRYIKMPATGYFVVAHDHGATPKKPGVADFVMAEPLP